MPRKLSSGRVGGPILGSLSTAENTLSSVRANANIAFAPDGTGIVESDSDIQLNGAKGIRLADNDSSNYALLRAPAALTANYTLTLPIDDGTSGQSLITDGNGNLTWSSASVAVTNQTADTTIYYPTITTETSGTLSAVSTSNTKLTFQPSTGTLTATALNGTNSTLSGTLTAATIVETSSITLKENIKPIENALESILKLDGVIYDRKNKSTFNEAGLIKEEVEKVLPNIVLGEGIQYTKLTAYLIEAVKTIKEEIDQLKGGK